MTKDKDKYIEAAIEYLESCSKILRESLEEHSFGSEDGRQVLIDFDDVMLVLAEYESKTKPYVKDSLKKALDAK